MIQGKQLALKDFMVVAQSPGHVLASPGSAVAPAALKRILVIDDEPVMRQLVGESLRDRGYEVIEAGSGDLGIELARELLPELILCDVRMKGMSGFEVLAALRADPLTATIPFILMTGQDDPAGSGMRQGMELGADDYLRKPFTLDSLHATLEARLKKAQMIRADTERKLAALRDNISLMLPHELRTPLNGILAYGELLRTDSESLPPEEVAEMGGDIVESGQRLERLIENFLIYTQTELIGSDPQRIAALRGKPSSHAALIVEAHARKQAERCNRAGDLDLELHDVPVAMSEEYLGKVVEELVQNAFKFSVRETPVSVSLFGEDGRVHLNVSDMGRGMTASEVSQIGAFMQFGRRSHEQQGLGLGLTIARRLVGLYGGDVLVRSQQGEGTRVCAVLPCG